MRALNVLLAALLVASLTPLVSASAVDEVYDTAIAAANEICHDQTPLDCVEHLVFHPPIICPGPSGHNVYRILCGGS